MLLQDWEDQEYEFNARYDYPREAFYAEIGLSKREAQMDEQWQRELHRAIDWLTEQGGLVEMAAASQEFHDDYFYQLERDGRIQRVVPEGCSRMHWAIAEQVPVEPIPVAVAPTEANLAAPNEIPF